MINLKRVISYSLLSIAIIGITIALFCNIQSQHSAQAVEPTPQKCSEFTVLINRPDSRVECPLGFIETQETEHGNILVVCSCKDPLRCSQD